MLIFFDTATYDEIERDVKVRDCTKITVFLSTDQSFAKVTTEAQLGLIGGTMGLLTGFSILSGVEIVYYLLRLQCCNTLLCRVLSIFQILSKNTRGFHCLH